MSLLYLNGQYIVCQVYSDNMNKNFNIKLYRLTAYLQVTFRYNTTHYADENIIENNNFAKRSASYVMLFLPITILMGMIITFSATKLRYYVPNCRFKCRRTGNRASQQVRTTIYTKLTR